MSNRDPAIALHENYVITSAEISKRLREAADEIDRQTSHLPADSLTHGVAASYIAHELLWSIPNTGLDRLIRQAAESDTENRRLAQLGTEE